MAWMMPVGSSRTGNRLAAVGRDQSREHPWIDRSLDELDRTVDGRRVEPARVHFEVTHGTYQPDSPVLMLRTFDLAVKGAANKSAQGIALGGE